MKTKLSRWLLSLALLATLNPQLSTAQAQGTAFTYQGRLNDGGGPASGVYDVQFAVYDSTNLPGTIIAGPITNSAVGVSNGLFTTALDFGASPFTGPDRWLDIAVRTNGSGTFTAVSPRQKLTPTPYAIFANTASNLSGALPSADLSGTYGGAVTFNNAGDSFSGNGTGLTNVNAATLGGLTAANFWQLGGNTISSGQFIGSLNSMPLDLYADGVRAMRLILRTDAMGAYSNAPNVIGGSPVNQVNSGVVGGTVGGGGGNDRFGTSFPNTVTADFGTVSGGIDNSAGGESSTVTGGTGNIASGDAATVSGGVNTASGEAATVAGGYVNTAGGDYASVAGGYGNTASGIGSFIGGGGYDGTILAGNKAQSKAAVVGGGIGNNVRGGSAYAVIAGGIFNTNSGTAATLGGGTNNEANGDYSTLGGGLNNSAGGGAATIGGGGNNTASGSYATVMGGFQNTASGNFSFAAGALANAAHNGSFVWADDNNFSFSSTANNQFSARAIGGVRFVSAIDGSGNATAGVKLNSGDTSWSTISDRNAKKNFQPVNGEAVLEKLVAIPVEQWNYKWETDTNTPHLGPMAQDFKAAFYPGRDDKVITTLEFDGVELAAIQGVNQKLEAVTKEKDVEIQILKSQNASLAERLNALETAVKALAANK